MFARFDEIPAMTLQDIKETKRYGWTHGRMDKVKTVYPPQTKFAGVQLCFNILAGLQYERPWLKGQRSTVTLVIVSLD